MTDYQSLAVTQWFDMKACKPPHGGLWDVTDRPDDLTRRRRFAIFTGKYGLIWFLWDAPEIYELLGVCGDNDLSWASMTHWRGLAERPAGHLCFVPPWIERDA